MSILNFSEYNAKQINEDEGKHEYSCAMLYYELPDMKDIHAQIDEDDIYNGKSGDDRGYGLEDEAHTTLLYGLHDDKVDPKEIEKICLNVEYPDVKLKNVSAFKNDDYDVLKFDVEGDGLYKANKELVKLPHTTDFPKYHPHSTIGYLKPGKADKYIKKLKGKQYSVKPTHIVYSRANDETLKFPLPTK